ncbi:MAG: hypothetical protein ACFFB2_20340, partial [Promethearchaeota archaeon]
MSGYYSDTHSNEFFITILFSKVKRRKRIELIILISCISIVGYLWVWILAIWWLWSFRRVDENFITIWSQVPQFEGEFPYRRENFDIIAKDWQYFQLVKRKNSVKIVLMVILAIPLYGYLLMLVGTILTLGIILLFLYNQMKKPDNYLSTRIRRKIQIPASPRIGTGIFCERCGKQLPPHARYCVACAYPVDIPQQKEVFFQRVSFRQAVDLLDSETYRRSARMDIEFECLVHEQASPELTTGPAPHRTIRVTDPGQLIIRTLYIWGDP